MKPEAQKTTQENTQYDSQTMRDNTDTSLRGEREKTDEYLDEKTHKITSDAEDTIRADRTVADDKRKLARNARDIVNAAAENLNPGSDNSSEHTNIAVERERSDNARILERKKEDAVRQKERFQKRLVAEALLAGEREETDSSLLDERAGIDSEGNKNSSLLTEELTSHALTKTELVTRDQFLAIVSHDLKNPLSSIAMSADLMRSELSEDKSKNAAILQYVDIIERNAASMDRLITDLLDVERMGNDKLTLKLSSVKVCDLLNECRDMFGPIIKGKSLELSVEKEDDTLIAKADFDRLLQVISNLIGNAIKFTPAGGTIKISAKRKESFVEFSVTDDGPGIEESKKTEIFERFSQLKSNDRRGLGLGLFISKWIVEAHKGKIGVNSKVGSGSTFYFTIPILQN